jgi:hypothetical protein
MVIGRIAHEDFPDAWPTLLETLMSYILSREVIPVQGALRALVLFAEDISEQHLPTVVQHLFPVLLGVVQAPQVFPPRVRMRAVAVYRNCLMSLFEKLDDASSAAVTALIGATLPAWMEAFRVVLVDADVRELGMVPRARLGFLSLSLACYS